MARVTRALQPERIAIEGRYAHLISGSLRPVEDLALEQVSAERDDLQFLRRLMQHTLRRQPSDALYLYQILGLLESGQTAEFQSTLAHDHLQHRQVICRLFARLRADALAVLPADHPIRSNLEGGQATHGHKENNHQAGHPSRG